MSRRKFGPRLLILSALLLVFPLCCVVYAGFTGKYTAGMTMPDLSFQGLTSPVDQEYLGVKGKDSFTLSQVSAKVICLDVLSAL